MPIKTGDTLAGVIGRDRVEVDIPLKDGDSLRSKIKQVASGPLRRHDRVPGQRRPDPDQDGAGREARRRRPAARPQGQRIHREAALLGAGCRPDFAAAAPRHLLDRGSGAADPRPEERQSAGVDQRQAGVRSRRRHRRRRRGQGQGRPRDDRRPRWRHRRIAGVVDQACRHAVGTGPGRNAADAGAQPPARPHRGAGRRPDEDRSRRRHRRAARRRRVRLRDGAAGRRRLHHDAQVPPEHLPGRRGDAGPGAARQVQGPARARRQLLLLRRRGSARDHGAARHAHVRRTDRPRRPARHASAASSTGKRGGSTSAASSTSRRCRRTSRGASSKCRTTASRRRSTTS